MPSSLLRSLRNLATHLDEVRRDAVHVDGDGPREILDRVRQFDDLVTVHARHGVVHVPQQSLLALAVLFSSRVLQVVCVDDAHHVPELVAPAHAVVEPRQVLRLLQNCHVRLLLGHALSDVAHGHDATLVDGVPPRVEVNVKCGLEINTPHQPLADVRPLLLRVVEYGVRVHQLLVARRQPGNHQRDPAPVAAMRQVCRAEERVDRGARHPREARRRHDGEPSAWITKRRWWWRCAGAVVVCWWCLLSNHTIAPASPPPKPTERHFPFKVWRCSTTPT
mmetsp:Transcript_35581/g.87525  ORF Transcript_35581/g.87525 Transcript_35581/m.87525 type:complete len:278 (+) Transcript_35581:54-887(+)